MKDYFALEKGDAWIEYLRARLPYSFMNIREEKRGRDRLYVLSDPQLVPGLAEYHNYWIRGNVYYVAGKLLDEHNLSSIWREHRRLEEHRLLLSRTYRVPYFWNIRTHDFYNSMQMEKIWAFAQQNAIDRERVVMTNISQAVELCLKAVKTHAEYRENGTFAFSVGHNLNEIYESLPQELREEIKTESRVFARQYSEFRTHVEKDVKKIHDRSSNMKRTPTVTQEDKLDWARIAKRIEESSYTAIVNSNDPGGAGSPDGNIGHVREDWFEVAMAQIRDSMYHRYSPEKDRDAYPVDPIYWGLMLGRFMYEHLFPVRLREEGRIPITDGLTIQGSDEWKEIKNILGE